MEAKNSFVCPHCGKEIDESLLNSWKARQVGRVISEKKAASSAANGKKGGRPPLVIKKSNIVVTEHNKSTKDRPGKHLTGWTLSYTYDDGRQVSNFYQAETLGYDLNKAKHLFFKVYVEPHQNG